MVASVKKPVQSKCRILQGEVGVHPCRMTLESGADYTVFGPIRFQNPTTRVEAALWVLE